MRRTASELFRVSFGVAPTAAASAPGRVNLIGEHTDYNGGPVLPIATPGRTYAVVGPGEPEVLEFVSTMDGRPGRIRWTDPLADRRSGAAYVAGVLRELWALDLAPPGGGGARVAVASELAVGAGLSSSSALTVACARALAALSPTTTLTPRQIAGVAFRAEHDHVGVRGGMMDQTNAALARPGHALLLECASLAVRHIPFQGRLLLVDTGVRHENAVGPYNERRKECEVAVERLKVELPELRWLASWPVEWLPRLKRALREPFRSRAVHVVSESARTRFAAQLLDRRRLQRFGELLYESHESCRRLYECSAPELDVVVAAAKRAGALGARLTGAGWGGNVLVLLGKGDGGRGKVTAKIIATITRAFRKAFGREPGITEVAASGGVRSERI